MNEVTFSERLSLCKKCITTSVIVNHSSDVGYYINHRDCEFFKGLDGNTYFVVTEEGREIYELIEDMGESFINELYEYFQRNHFLIRNNVDFEQLINDHNKLSRIEFDAKYFDVTW